MSYRTSRDNAYVALSYVVYPNVDGTSALVAAAAIVVVPFVVTLRCAVASHVSYNVAWAHKAARIGM